MVMQVTRIRMNFASTTKVLAKRMPARKSVCTTESQSAAMHAAQLERHSNAGGAVAVAAGSIRANSSTSPDRPPIGPILHHSNAVPCGRGCLAPDGGWGFVAADWVTSPPLTPGSCFKHGVASPGQHETEFRLVLSVSGWTAICCTVHQFCRRRSLGHVSMVFTRQCNTCQLRSPRLGLPAIVPFALLSCMLMTCLFWMH